MKVLIIDDDASIRKTTMVALQSMGYETAAAEDGEGAFEELDRGRVDAALLDLKLRKENGLELLPALLKHSPHLSVVVFTAFASIETAVEAIHRGAVDYIPKPFTPDQIRQVLAKVIHARQLQDRVDELESRLSEVCPTIDLETDDPGMKKVYEVLFKAAGTPATLLLLGESGTGKTVAARAAHARSAQRDHPFVTVSCPSLSRELLESELFGHTKGAFTGAARETWGKVAHADGGTLFLDEIGEMPMEIQPKLLRLLQEREYERVGETAVRRAHVRVIAATNRDLFRAVKEGRFREDLYYRLNVIAVTLPPLRERTRDVMRLAEACLAFYSAQCGKEPRRFSSEAVQGLVRYHWPGNLRELHNAVERAVILSASPVVGMGDLPESVAQAGPVSSTGCVSIGGRHSLEDLEAEHIRKVVESTPSLDQAAQVLGIDPATLYRKRKKFGLAT